MSLVMLALGVVFLYILPEYFVSTINGTAVFNNTQLATALNQVATLRGIGWAVIVISIIMLVVSVVGGALGGKKGR